MRPTAVVFAALAAAAFAAALAPPAASAAAADGCTTYGTGVTLDAATPVAALVGAAEEWAGKTVRVEGEVREVCPLAGCWLSIVADAAGPPLRVKVKDGEIVLPLSARGRRATAQGAVVVDDMSREEYGRWLEHLAAERGETYDPATLGEGPYRRLEVRATGVKICPAAAEAAPGE
jgi:hypothetical protein